MITPPDFFSILKDKYLLLDTNLFIDTSLKPTIFISFFKELKKNNNTITTLDAVIIEFLKGGANKQKYDEKLQLVKEIVDFVFPIKDSIIASLYTLTEKYGEEGKGASITDLLLGATIKDYAPDLYVITKNTSDFPLSIFELVTLFNAPYGKGIQTYGIYKYKNTIL